MKKKILPAFYRRDTIGVAQELLGKYLVRVEPNGKRISGRIVETEAYLGVEDPACHSWQARHTKKNASMYLPGGYSYVYLIYGMHNCFNVVTRKKNQPEAVLIRALEPLESIEEMQKKRLKNSRLQHLTNGPGKLCEALGITRVFDGYSLQGDQLFLEEDSAQSIGLSSIVKTGRIGVEYAGEAASWPLRFYLKESTFVSKP